MKSYVSANIWIKDASSVSTHHLTLSTGEVHISVTLAMSMDHSSTLCGSPEAMERFAEAILREVCKAAGGEMRTYCPMLAG